MKAMLNRILSDRMVERGDGSRVVSVLAVRRTEKYGFLEVDFTYKKPNTEEQKATEKLELYHIILHMFEMVRSLERSVKDQQPQLF